MAVDPSTVSIVVALLLAGPAPEWRPETVSSATPVRVAKAKKKSAPADDLDELPSLEVAEMPMSRSTGPLKMLGPERITLGVDTLAEIHLEAPASGTPRLVANVGKVGQPAPMEGGLLATYTPPDEVSPGVVIIAALRSDGSLWDWLSIPLLGQTVVNVKGARRAEVEIHIGDRKFGPTRTDRKGRARISVTTPPGVDTAMTVFTNKKGRRTEGTTPITAPRFNRMMLFCGARLSAVVVGTTGAPQPDQQLVLKGPGTFGVATMTSPGTYEIPFQAAAKVEPGARVKIKATLVGDKVSSDSCKLVVRSGSVANLAMAVEPTEVIAGSGIPVIVTLEVRDSAGRPAQPNSFDVSADFGSLGEVRSVAPGRFEAIWQLPADLKDKRRAFARVTVGEVNAEVGIDLRAARIARLNLRAENDSLTANGRATTTLTVKPLDPGGNLAPAQLSARANGTVGEFRGPDAEGHYEATYTAPLSFEATADQIVVEEADSGVSENLAIQLHPTRRTFLLGLKGGVTTNLGSIFTGIGMFDAAFRVPILDESIRVGVETGFMLHKSERPVEGGGRATISTWAVPILGRVAYGLAVADWLEIVLGGGAGIYLTHVDVSPNDAAATVRPQQLTKPAVAAGGLLGFEVAAGPGAFVIEGQYTWVGLDEGSVAGNVGGIAGFLGYRLAL